MRKQKMRILSPSSFSIFTPAAPSRLNSIRSVRKRLNVLRPMSSTPFSNENGNEEDEKLDLDYVKKMRHLTRLDENTFRSSFLLPGNRKSAIRDVYGGHIFAQAIDAAEATAGPQFAPHAVQSFFIKNASIDLPIEYTVNRLRDGRSYCTRSVIASQQGVPVFSAQMSLCVRERSTVEHQERMPEVPPPEQLAPFNELASRAMQDHESGERVLIHDQMAVFEFRPVDPNLWLGLSPHSPAPILYWLKCTVPLGADRDDRALNRFLLAFITDATMVSTANRPHMSHGHRPSMLFSLDHVVHFHDDANVHADEWMLCENVSPIAKNGRGFTLGRIWTRDGRHVVSVSQESLSRSRTEKISRL